MKFTDHILICFATVFGAALVGDWVRALSFEMGILVIGFMMLGGASILLIEVKR